MAECIECFNKGYASEVTTTDFRHCRTCSLSWLDERGELLADGTSTRRYTAVYLEEHVAISYGMKHEHCKQYELRRIIFYDGSHSSGGHYTCAERMQFDGCYQKGDPWRYLDSSKEPEVVSLHQLYMERGRDVAGLLLVVKNRPADSERDMPVVMAEERARYLPKPPAMKAPLSMPTVFATAPAPPDFNPQTPSNTKTQLCVFTSSPSDASFKSSHLNPEVQRVVDQAEKARAEVKQERRAQFPGKAEQALQKQQAAFARQQAYASATTTSTANLPVATAAVVNAAAGTSKLSAKERRRVNKEQKKAKLPLDGIVISSKLASAASLIADDNMTDPASSSDDAAAKGVCSTNAAPVVVPSSAASAICSVERPASKSSAASPPPRKANKVDPSPPPPAAMSLAAPPLPRKPNKAASSTPAGVPPAATSSAAPPPPRKPNKAAPIPPTPSCHVLGSPSTPQEA